MRPDDPIAKLLLREAARRQHRFALYLICERSGHRVPWTPDEEVPFCPCCGERLLEGLEL